MLFYTNHVDYFGGSGGWVPPLIITTVNVGDFPKHEVEQPLIIKVMQRCPSMFVERVRIIPGIGEHGRRVYVVGPACTVQCREAEHVAHVP